MRSMRERETDVVQRRAADVGGTPGKRTLTESIAVDGPAVQRKAATTAEAGSAGDGAVKDGDDGSYGGIVKAIGVDDASLVSDAAKPKDSEVAKLKKNDQVQPLDLGVGAAFNKGAEGTGKTWWKVRVLKCASAGKEGWIQVANLTSILKVTKEGKHEYTGKLGDGQVDIYTGQAIEKEGKDDGTNNFSLTYKGKDADAAQWLQFVWREIVGADDKDASTPVKDSITTSGGTYDLTANGTFTTPGKPAKNNYNTDSPNKSDPFYEATFEADRTADSATMNDLPSAMTTKVQDAFNNGAKKVVSRAHFGTFLLRSRKVAFKTGIDVQWDFAKKEDSASPPAGKHTVSGSGAATELPKTIAERFHEQYPAFKDIK